MIALVKSCNKIVNLIYKEQEAIHHSILAVPLRKTEYHILWSSTYQVPVLYFCLCGTPVNVDSLKTEVIAALVPKSMQKQLQEVGVMGGISMGVGQTCTSAQPGR